LVSLFEIHFPGSQLVEFTGISPVKRASVWTLRSIFFHSFPPFALSDISISRRTASARLPQPE
jgi:hypothetical protein